MANILAIDTADKFLSLALKANGKVYSYVHQVENQHSLFVLDKIKLLLDQANIAIDEVNYIAYLEGPGSFTGLRIGLSVALGISMGSNVQLIAIPTFALYAMASKYAGDIVIAIDARINQIYVAGINTTTLDYFMQPQVIDPEALVIHQKCVLGGEGFAIYADKLGHVLTCHDKVVIDYPKPEYLIDVVELNKYPSCLNTEASLSYLRNKVALTLEEQRKINN
jgi:tRNA threonylcarbamoyladenosine biosynthesis protein TsaB